MGQFNRQRGFVTIATGEDRYYQLAKNLLHSYHLHTAASLPFAILCDRKNSITAEFDDVVLLGSASKNYNDKLKLFEYMPFEETIFIDADCLAYGDLNVWFEMFEGQGDFSCFGCAYRDLTTTQGWFSVPGMGKYSDSISFIPSFNGGVYYMRNTETCNRVFQIARECADQYHQYAFNGFKNAADEPLLALGMAVCGCEPLNEDEMVFAPAERLFDLDIISGHARRKSSGKNYRLIHWSNYLTEKKAYHLEVWKMDNNGKYGKVFSFFISQVMRAYDIRAFALRLYRAIRRRTKTA